MLLNRHHKKHKRRRAFLLPLALAFLFILLFLEIGLFTLQQQAENNAFNESSRLARLVGTEELHTQLAQNLSGSQSDVLPMTGGVTYQVPKSRVVLTSKWENGKSVTKPLPTLWATYDSVLKRAPELPELSYWQTGKDGKIEQTDLPPGHTRFQLSANGDRKTSVVSYSPLFPYGLYSPSGSIVADSVSSFTNVVDYTKTDNLPILIESGRPVDIYAGEDIRVTNSYTSGSAKSLRGKIELPDDHTVQGAIPLSGHPAPRDQWGNLFNTLNNLKTTVSSRTLDKTHFLDDQLFTLDHLKRIFKGDVGDLLSIFSVGQACKVPFFPIPGIQDDAPLLIVFYIMHPYPVDFSGSAGDKKDSERLKELAQEISEKKAELDEKEQQLAQEQAKEKPDQDTVDRLAGEIAALKDQIKSLEDETKKIAKKRDKEKGDIAKQLSQAEIPETAGEDAEQLTTGWSYLFVIGELFNIVKDLITGHDPFADIFIPTRVIHLGDMGPEWEWGDGAIEIRANLTVPRGRSLKISKPQVKVIGDIYLQDGATLYIEGDLKVERPAGWVDFKGVKASDYGGFPLGRVILEEGSNLIASGAIDIAGGDYNNGSVMLTSEYAPNHGITSLIHAGGDISLRYGMMPAVTFGDLVGKLAEDKSALRGFNDDFFRPLTEQVFTILGRLPYGGPWQWRQSYFAKYATTFDFIPLLEEFALGGPWPIPLPFDNCLNKVFKYMSIAYADHLNAFTGENLYTHSPFWPFGRGVTPILLKVNPKLLEDSLGDLKWGKITLDSLEEVALDFVKETLPSFAVGVIKNVVVEVIKQAVLSEIPFKPPSCGDQEANEAKEMEKVVEEFVKETLKDFACVLKTTFFKVLLTMKNQVYYNLDSNDDEYAYLRQVAGVAVASGGRIEIGKDAAGRLASGLFIARSDITINCRRTVGVVVSTDGSIEVDDFLHFPYFDRLSVYNPKKYGEIMESLLDFGDPKGECIGDISHTFSHPIAQGWIK